MCPFLTQNDCFNRQADIKKNQPDHTADGNIIGQKRQAEENVPSLINEEGELTSTDTDKAEVLNEFFASAFTGSQAFHASPVPEPLGGDQGNKISHTVREEQVQDCLM